ncbi:MAG: hypothetical protein KGZ25_07280 [Planctomycetes bacterium]|nr:hypothetical protein [Planctomycetota bacterium]
MAKKNYGYGECWWREYRYHDNTQLLLHFGAPQVSGRDKLAKKVKKTRKEEAVFDDLDPGSDDGLGVEEIEPDPMAFRKGPRIDPEKVPADQVQDYAHAKHRIRLPEGMRKIDEGRFGGGLLCTGGQGMMIKTGAPNSIELSFNISEFPDETQCLWSTQNDEARLLLHPDGRLEFKLKEPHGHPAKNPNRKTALTEAELKAIMARDAQIISKKPVSLNRWVHARVYRHPHPTPGGGSPWDARLVIDGKTVDRYLSERYNMYRFFGRREVRMVLANSAAGDQGFVGKIDECRLIGRHKTFYERPPMPWRDSEHELQFGRPWFRNDSFLFRATLGKRSDYVVNEGNAGPIQLDLKGGKLEGLIVGGIRGKGWVMDPVIGFPRFPLDGMSAEEGALEFWMRPVNWDDCTGYWHHSPPPHRHLTVARFLGRDRRDGKVKRFMSVRLQRAHNLERGRRPLDPGHWMHIVVSWHKGNRKWAGLRVQPVGERAKSHGVRRDPELIANVDPLYVQFGVPDNVTVKWHQKPRIEIDEVVGYKLPLAKDERQQAFRRWTGKIDPIRLYEDRLHFKWSLQKLEYTWKPRLPGERTAKEVELTLKRRSGENWKRMGETRNVPIRKGRAFAVLHRETKLPEGRYRVEFTARNDAGETVLKGSRHWDYEEEPWRYYSGGILKTPPHPWIPIERDGGEFRTRMTTYRLAQNGLPQRIDAKGKNLLASPIRLLEDGAPMDSGNFKMDAESPTKVRWRSQFRGQSANLNMKCRLEYDGMIRYELKIEPKGEVQPLTFEIPIRSERARRYLYYPMGSRGVKTGVIKPQSETILESRVDPISWRQYKRARRKNRKLSWSEYRSQQRKNREAYGFYGHVDVHDMNRGLFWFCDNAAGWHQSKTKSAIEIVRRDDGVIAMRFNLVAEPVDYEYERPIVFAIIPHPARPMPDKYRLFDRVSSEKDPKACSVFDAFRPWPMDPKYGNMKIFPAADPEKPGEGPSWEYAERCVPIMKSAKPVGYRTMYLSLKWMSCRAGAYDGWEWRSGGSGAASLTHSFVNYLCWEMNEWIGRDIFDAVYLDECYEERLRNLEAGMSVRLPDGGHQPGVDNFHFRELMKRWYGLFVKHDQTPMLLAHCTHSFQYPGLLYTQAYLDGENSPIVSLKSRDWIDSTSKQRFETVQNGYLWGTTPFYMPYISEGGFAEEKDEFKVWQWRMARQAQSMFAHYEVGTVYEGQGAGVYRSYWNDLFQWGVGDPDQVPFYPYWNNGEYLNARFRPRGENEGTGRDQSRPPANPDWEEGHTGNLRVSFYRRGKKILLIASNNRKKDVVAEIQFEENGLALPDNPEARSVDSTFNPPPGSDYQKTDTKRATADLAEEGDLLGGEDETGVATTPDELFNDPVETKKRSKNWWKPTINSRVLTVPIRARDYRVIAIE